MPMDPGFFGSNADGSESREYCRCCYKEGAFIEPELTKAAMIEKMESHLIRVMQFTDEKAKEIANEFIPPLKRWQ